MLHLTYLRQQPINLEKEYKGTKARTIAHQGNVLHMYVCCFLLFLDFNPHLQDVSWLPKARRGFLEITHKRVLFPSFLFLDWLKLSVFRGKKSFLFSLRLFFSRFQAPKKKNPGFGCCDCVWAEQPRSDFLVTRVKASLIRFYPSSRRPQHIFFCTKICLQSICVQTFTHMVF